MSEAQRVNIMKQLLVGLLALGSIYSFAGTIESKRTGEMIQVDLVQEDLQFKIRNERTVTILSTQVARNNSQIDLLGGLHSVGKYMDSIDPERSEVADLAMAPLEIVYIVGAGAYDVISFPIKGPIKWINNSKNKKDIEILTKVASSDVVTFVNHKRFQRIERLLTNL